MILFVWGMVFMIALVPGVLVGWIAGKLPLPGWLLAVLMMPASVAVGFIASKMQTPTEEMHRHIENLIVYAPPIAVALLLGLRISRAPRRPQPRPWYLPRE
jgi:hypothetical protein